MSTSIRPSMTKPRKSQLVLEGTAAVVSSVLLLWLFLWFVYQQPRTFKVAAYQAPLTTTGGFTPYLEADVRGLTRDETTGRINPVDGAELLSKATTSVGQKGSALVLSISAPTVPDLGGVTTLELIRKVAKAARRDVLIVLDLAQVDSDREIGVFGNAPYQGLREQLAKEPRPENAKVFVLCSAAPGQKSWMIDGLGRSAFSHFLQAGLAGEAKEDDGQGGKSPISVDELHRFVLLNTSRWVAGNRRGAIQTPMLLPVGPGQEPFKLPPIDVKKPGQPASAGLVRAEPAASTKVASPDTQAKDTPSKPGPEVAAVPESKSLEAFLKPLLEEWKQHDELAKESRHLAVRSAPAHWRIYESRLLKAERMTRASWKDPGLRGDAEAALESAKGYRLDDLADRINKADDDAKRFPFHPVRGDVEGAQALNASLKFVTGRILEELDVPKFIPPPAGLPPVGGANGAGPGPVAVEGGRVAETVPPLLAAADGYQPMRYLELQLPAWAYRFHTTFLVESFKNDPQGALLKDIVRKRLPAESALDLDRRGLRWIEKEIQAGDKERRAVQDELFAVTNQAAGMALTSRIAAFGSKYEEAAERIGDFHKARELFERIAARLPYLGEWAVLNEVGKLERTASLGETPSNLPAHLVAAIAATSRLVEEIEQPAGRPNLDDASKKAARAFDDLEADYNGVVDGLLNRTGRFEWRDIDDALVCPTMKLEDRAKLLRKILGQDAPVPESKTPEGQGEGKGDASPPTDPKSDPGFRWRAFGLARLDIELKKLGAAGPQAASVAVNGLKALEANLNALASMDDTKLGEVLGGLADFGKEIRDIKAPTQGELGSEEVMTALLNHDRDVRLRTERELTNGLNEDRASMKLEAYADRAAIRFHARRLAEDYAREVPRLNALADAYEAAPDEQPIPAFNGDLRPLLPESPVEIDETNRASMALGVKVSEESGPESVPKGRAFVGVLAPPSVGVAPKAPEGETSKDDARLQVTIPGQPPRSATGLLAGALVAVAVDDQKPLSFLVEQKTSAEGTDPLKSLPVKIFYRGRVDEGAEKNVVVHCRKFGKPVLVKITQDRDALKRRFGAANEATIQDQFEKTPDQGFLHCGGQINFILTISNKTLEAQNLTIKRTFEPADPKFGNFSPVQLLLGPGASQPLPAQTLTHDDVPIEKPRVLKVEVFNARNELKEMKQYIFTQLKLEESIRVNSGFDSYRFRKDAEACPVYKVEVIRRTDDPVTEPILRRNIKVEIGKSMSEDDQKDEILGRNSDNSTFPTYFKLYNRDVPPWTVTVDGVLWKNKP